MRYENLSSKVNKIKKSIKPYAFPSEMYGDFIGTFFIVCHVFAKEKQNVNDIVKKWKENRKTEKFKVIAPEDVMKSKDIYNEMAEYVGYEIPYGNIAYIWSKFNALHCIIDDDNNIYPLREDGWVPRTYIEGVKESQFTRLYDYTKKRK